ncbi:MAG: helix-turn-helix domain-containing protein [Chlamydiia bacterium]
MSAHTKERLTKEVVYKVVVEMPDKAKKLSFVPAKHLEKLEAFLDKYGESESILWKDLAKDRIAKYTKAGLALRGARYREGLSQKELSRLTGISQENISRMENGQRAIGKAVANKLAKALHIAPELLAE